MTKTLIREGLLRWLGDELIVTDVEKFDAFFVKLDRKGRANEPG